MDFNFWFSLSSFISSLLLLSFSYGKLRKETQSNSSSVEKLEQFKEAQIAMNATFETREEAKRCSENHSDGSRAFATKEELASATERIRDSILAISDRIKEDREKNNSQHKEFYFTDDKVIEVKTSLVDLNRRMCAVEGDTKSILAIVTSLQPGK